MMNDAAVAMMSEALCVVEREREKEREKFLCQERSSAGRIA